MKVTKIEPGKTYAHAAGWAYTIQVNDRMILSEQSYASANAAKQAMREKVAHERKKHGLLT